MEDPTNPVLDDGWADVMETVEKTYEPKALGLLRNVRAALEKMLVPVPNEPFSMCDDQILWELETGTGHQYQGGEAGVEIEVVTQRENEGEGFGMNFRLAVVQWGGRVFLDWQPFNFSNRVWVDARDSAAVAARWDELVCLDMAELTGQVREALGR
jgi:hypothetical protein